MLDPKGLDIARRLIREEIDERKENLKLEVERVKNTMVLKGHGRSGAIIEEIHRLYAREIEIRAQYVFQKLLEVLSDVGIQPSDTLAGELKQEFLAHQDLIMSGLKESLEKEAGLIGLPALSLGNARDRAISRIYARCEQYALSLSRRTEAARASQSGAPVSSQPIFNINSFHGSLQTGAGSTANVIQNIGSHDREALIQALDLESKVFLPQRS